MLLGGLPDRGTHAVHLREVVEQPVERMVLPVLSHVSHPATGSRVGSAAGTVPGRAAACALISACSALNSDIANPIITKQNGAAAMIAARWSASSPPVSSSTAATRPVAEPHQIVTARAGSSTPRELSMPITRDAASAPLTKNSATSTITITDIT